MYWWCNRGQTISWQKSWRTQTRARSRDQRRHVDSDFITHVWTCVWVCVCVGVNDVHGGQSYVMFLLVLLEKTITFLQQINNNNNNNDDWESKDRGARVSSTSLMSELWHHRQDVRAVTSSTGRILITRKQKGNNPTCLIRSKQHPGLHHSIIWETKTRTISGLYVLTSVGKKEEGLK